MNPMRDALLEPRLFAGMRTVVCHVSHEWGMFFCRDCGAWPDDAEGREQCTGPKWAWDQWKRAVDDGLTA